MHALTACVHDLLVALQGVSGGIRASTGDRKRNYSSADKLRHDATDGQLHSRRTRGKQSDGLNPDQPRRRQLCGQWHASHYQSNKGSDSLVP